MPEPAQGMLGFSVPQQTLTRQLFRRVIVGRDVPAPCASFSVRPLPMQYAHLEIIVRGKTDSTGSDISLVVFTVDELPAGSTEYTYAQTQSSNSFTGSSTASIATPVMGGIAASNASSAFPLDASGSIHATFIGYASNFWHKQMVSQSFVQMRATTATTILYSHGASIRTTRPITGLTFALGDASNFLRGTQFDFYGDP